MIIVTGCNGFIGSNLVAKLNELGVKDIIGVDDLSKKDNLINIAHCELQELLDIKDFENGYLQENQTREHITHIFHQGACSDTLEWDAEYMMRNNYSFSQRLLELAENNSIAFIYASSASMSIGIS